MNVTEVPVLHQKVAHIEQRVEVNDSSIQNSYVEVAAHRMHADGELIVYPGPKVDVGIELALQIPVRDRCELKIIKHVEKFFDVGVTNRALHVKRTHGAKNFFQGDREPDISVRQLHRKILRREIIPGINRINVVNRLAGIVSQISINPTRTPIGKRQFYSILIIRLGIPCSGPTP